MKWNDNVHKGIRLFFNKFIEQNFLTQTDNSVWNLLFLSPEEAGLLLGDAVFPLGQRELGTVPSKGHKTSKISICRVLRHSCCVRLVQKARWFFFCFFKDVNISHLFFLTSLGGFFSWTGFSRMVAWAFLYISSIWKKTNKQTVKLLSKQFISYEISGYVLFFTHT